MPSQSPEIYSSLPDNLSPAIVAKLFITYAGYERDLNVSSARSKDNSFFATLLDLAANGVISIRKCADGFMIGINDYYYKTNDYENTVLEFLKTALNGKAEISDKEFEKYYSALPTSEYQRFNQFSKQVNEEYKKFNFTEEIIPKKHTAIPLIIFPILSVLLSVFFFNIKLIDKNPIVSSILGVVISAVLVLTFCLYIKIFRHKYIILTQEGEDKLALWKAFGQYLDNLSPISFQHLSDTSILKKYMAYSIVLGRNFNFNEWISDNYSYISQSVSDDKDLSAYILLSSTLKTISYSNTSYGTGDSYYSSGSDFSGGGCDSGSSGGSFD